MWASLVYRWPRGAIDNRRFGAAVIAGQILRRDYSPDVGRRSAAADKSCPSLVAILNQYRLRDHRSLALIGVCFALLVGRALAGGDFIEGAPFSFHAHMRVAREHGARNVPGDAHDDFIARARLR